MASRVGDSPWTLGDEVTADPTAAGLPGTNVARDLVNWTAQLALWGSLPAILIGAATWGLSHHAAQQADFLARIYANRG